MLINKERVLQVMQKYGVEVLVGASPENVTYLTDFWGLSHWVLKGTQNYAIFPAAGKVKPYVITSVSDLDQGAMEGECWVTDFVPFGNFYLTIPPRAALEKSEERLQDFLALGRKENAAAALVESLAERGLAKGKIAIDQMSIPAHLYRTIEENLPGAEVIDGYPLLREIRAVKTAEEILRLEQSAEITEKAFHRALGHIREGVREAEIAEVFNTTLAEFGAVPALTCIGAGYRSGFPNVVPSDYRVKKGDLIRFDIGCLYKLYYSDTARIAVLGKPSEKQRAYYQAVKEGEDRALERVRAGAEAAEVFNAAVEGVRQGGIAHYQRTHVGHGIGIECYDIPSLSPTSGHVLEEGMVINVETPYYEMGFGGVQVEDTLVVTRGGYRLLTKADRNLFVV